MEYPFRGDQINVRAVAEWIARIAHANEHFPDALKKVGQRIRDGRQLKFSDNIGDPSVFFDWAITKWPELKNINDLPRIVVTPTIAASAQQGQQSSFSLSVPPKDYEKLLEAYCGADSERQKLQHENRALKLEVERLGHELSVKKALLVDLEQKRIASNKKKGRRVSWD